MSGSSEAMMLMVGERIEQGGSSLCGFKGAEAAARLNSN